jgi:hypothetical protein
MLLSVKTSPAMIAGLERRLADPHGPHAVRTWLCNLGAAALQQPTQPADAFDNANTPEHWETICV